VQKEEEKGGVRKGKYEHFHMVLGEGGGTLGSRGNPRGVREKHGNLKNKRFGGGSRLRNTPTPKAQYQGGGQRKKN